MCFVDVCAVFFCGGPRVRCAVRARASGLRAPGRAPGRGGAGPGAGPGPGGGGVSRVAVRSSHKCARGALARGSGQSQCACALHTHESHDHESCGMLWHIVI